MGTMKPITNDDTVAKILKTLERDNTPSGKRAYLLFATGIYTGLRISDIVGLRKCNVSGERIDVIEEKTDKKQSIKIAKMLRKIYDERLQELGEDDYLFQSRKHLGKETQCLTVRGAQYVMKDIANRFGLENFNSHSMRKTYGYWQYKSGKMTLAMLQKRFNHSDERITRRYIGLDAEETDKADEGLNFGGYRPDWKSKPGREKKGDSVPMRR